MCSAMIPWWSSTRCSFSGLPLTLFFPFYPALLLVPAWRNRSDGPVRVLVDHLVYGFRCPRGTGHRDEDLGSSTRPESLSESCLYGEMQHLGVRGHLHRRVDALTNAKSAASPTGGRCSAYRRSTADPPALGVVFAFPGRARFPVMRQVAYIWFLVWLRVCRMLGMHLVWTAHNVLPHRRRSSPTMRPHGGPWSRPVISCLLTRNRRWPNSPHSVPWPAGVLSSSTVRSL